MDTMFSKVKSILGNTCTNVFTQGKFTRVVPMSGSTEARKSFCDFTDDVGIPETLWVDGAGEFTGKHTDFVKETRRCRTKLKTTEKGRKNQNHYAEGEIATLKKQWKHRMARKKAPRRVWDFGLVYESEILSLMACGHNRHSGYEEVFGETPDISEWLDFDFYDLVWWLDDQPSYPDEKRRLTRWLGVSH